MSEAARAAVIQEHCKELKLAAVVREYPALCRQARDGGWAFCSGGDQRIRGRDGYRYAEGDGADSVDPARTGRLHILEVQRLIRFMHSVGVGTRPSDHGVGADEWDDLVEKAMGGERGRNFIGRVTVTQT